MTGVPIQDDEGEQILALRRQGYSLQEIARIVGRRISTISVYLSKRRKMTWEMKTDEYWQMVVTNRERLDRIIELAMDTLQSSDPPESARMTAAVNAIETQNRLLALSDFVKEQRANDHGDSLTIVVDKTGFRTYTTPDLETEEANEKLAGTVEPAADDGEDMLVWRDGQRENV